MYVGKWRQRGWISAYSLAVAVLVVACQPKVQLVAPEEPIVINLNIKIEQEVRVKVERELETLLETHPELF